MEATNGLFRFSSGQMQGGLTPEHNPGWQRPWSTAGRKASPVLTSAARRFQYRDTWLIRNIATLGPYNRNMPRALWWPYEGGLFRISEVPLYARRPQHSHRRQAPRASGRESPESKWAKKCGLVLAQLTPGRTLAYYRNQTDTAI